MKEKAKDIPFTVGIIIAILLWIVIGLALAFSFGEIGLMIAFLFWFSTSFVVISIWIKTEKWKDKREKIKFMKQKMQKWKEEGYKVDKLEKMLK